MEIKKLIGEALCRIGFHKAIGPPPFMTRELAEKISREGYEDECFWCGKQIRTWKRPTLIGWIGIGIIMTAGMAFFGIIPTAMILGQSNTTWPPTFSVVMWDAQFTVLQGLIFALLLKKGKEGVLLFCYFLAGLIMIIFCGPIFSYAVGRDIGWAWGVLSGLLCGFGWVGFISLAKSSTLRW